MKNLYLLFFLLASTFAAAQCYLPQDLEARMADSDMVVAGTVVESRSFYNNFGEIYTMHKLSPRQPAGPGEIAVPPDTVFFFTMGGTINEEKMVAYPSLRDVTDASGVFMLKLYTGDRVSFPGTIYRPTAVHESVMLFEPETGNFTDGDNFAGTLTEVDALVRSALGRPLVDLNPGGWTPQRITGRSAAPSITSLSPLNVSAGVGDVLTINGNGFGSSPGAVFFDNPDDGTGGSFTGVGAEDILSWTNTRIRVRVISNGGSGRVIVRSAAGQQTTSSQSVDIDFAVTNLNLTSGEIVTPRLIDDEADGKGGYIFAVGHTRANGGVSLADNGPALAALNRAITTWQQDGDYSVYLQGTTTIQEPSRDDNVNIVAFGSNRYDFDVELGSGTVGIAFSYYNACGSSEFEVTGMDVLFRRPGNPNGFGGSVNYNYGPGFSGGSDFESIALHEFGHTKQLKHVADPSDVMAFRVTNGQTQRDLGTGAAAGAEVVSTLAQAYDPPVINCGGDFPFVRDYLTFSQAGGAVLPVEWLAFTAVNAPKNVRLDWATATEVANDHFRVERSVDGREFTPIGRVAAVGNGTAGADYAFTDEQPIAGTTYYRITQVDLSGAFSHSSIAEIVRGTGAGLLAYPNPAVSVLNVVHEGEADRYIVSDLNGRQLQQFAVQPGETTLRLDVRDLPSGQYVLRASDGRVTRFVH